jgi:predicted acetyltransferase
MLEYVVTPDEAQLAALGILVDHSFRLPPGSWPSILERMPGGHRVVRREGQVAGGLAIYDMGHWFGGRSVRTWGLAAVCVDPVFRAQGVGHALMVECLRECASAGVPISTLFPSTTAFYRTVGYERAGNRIEHVLDVRRIGVRGRSLDIWPADRETLREIAGRAGSRGAGVIDRSSPMWDRLLDPRGSSPVYAYACGMDGRAEGTLVYQTSPALANVGQNAAFGYDVQVREMWGLTPDAIRTWWAYLHDMRTMVRDVRWYGPASDPRTFLLPDQPWSFGRVWQWMLRIVDVRAAISSRGWAADGTLDLDLVDPLLPENNGRWRITVEDGVGVATRGGTGAIALDVKALAPLYTGLSSAETLSDLGLLAGGARDLATASSLFAGPEPWFQDMF